MDERRPGVWRLRVYVGRDVVTGKKLSASRTFHGTQRQAETALAAFVSQQATGDAHSPSMTVSGLLAAFCDHAENIGRSPTTVAEYKRLSRNLADGIGRRLIEKLQPKDLDELYFILGTRGVPGGQGPLSPASVNRYHDLLKAAFKQAQKWGWVRESPVDRATAPTERKAAMGVPTPEELHALINRSSVRNNAHGMLIAVAAMTGARRGELCALRWSDVDIDEGVVYIRRAVQQVGKSLTIGDTKTHAERRVALPDEAVDVLRLFHQQLGERAQYTHIPLAADPFIFSPAPDHGRPYPPHTLTNMFSRHAKALGLPYHLHQLRHFAATQLIAAGHDAVTVGNRLGHADPSVTLRVYAHALEDRDRAAANTLGGIVVPTLDKSPQGE